MQRAKLQRWAVIMLWLTWATMQGFALNARTHHHSRRGHFHRVAWNPVLRGSYESLLRQNEEIDRLQLPRILDEAQLVELESRQELVLIENSSYLTVASNLKPAHRYCRAWTRDFLEDIGRSYYDEFHQPLQITSAVRTIQQQRKLRRRNRNAAPEVGKTASSHLAGISVDILKRGMTGRQHQWVEQYLYALREQGVVEPEEERRQPVFHVMVSDRYTEWRISGDSEEIATLAYE